MLDALRRGAKSWIIKWLLLIPLVVAFAIWGVADVFRGFGAGSLAKVGKIEISTEEFRRAYELQLDDLRRRTQGRINAEQARLFGIDQQVLSRLVGSTAVDAHARELKLGLSDAAIADMIQRDATFAGPDGKFSKLAFDEFMRRNGLNEPRYLNLRRREEVRDQITASMLGEMVVPTITAELMHRYREETRLAEHFTLDAAKVVKLPAPEEAKLKETYEQNKTRFVTPEYRKLGVLLLSGDDIKKAIPIADADIKAAYDADKDRFTVPERRRVRQISFPTKAAADAAAKAIANGKSFMDAAKEAGAKESDVELGLLTKREMIDPKIADAAFSVAKDKVSPVVEGRFSTVLVTVTEIQPGKQRTLDEVKGEVRDKLAGEKANREIQQQHDKVDELRGQGKPLKEIGTTLKLKNFEVAATDREGKAPDGKPAFEGPDGQRIVAAAFDAKTGVETEAIELGDGGYAWIDLIGTTAEKQREYADVTADVKALWTELETRKALSEASNKFAERARSGESMEKLAAEAGGKLETTPPFRRGAPVTGLSEQALRQAFALPKGGAGATDSADGKSRTILRIADIKTPAAPTKEELERLKPDIANQLRGDVVAEYIAALQDRLGVTINEAEFRRATGADRATQ
jgi:peptidyl-prolyl cis-trans isomerase D